MSSKQLAEDKRAAEIRENAFMPSPRPGGFIKIKLDLKEKKKKVLQFDNYQNIISRVEDMEKEKYKTEKTVVKNPIPPKITPIRSLNLPKISQESLFEKYLVENDENDNSGDYEKWLDETAPAHSVNLLDNLEEVINMIIKLASNPNEPAKEFDEMQAISVIQFLRTIKTSSGQYEPNNSRLMEYIDSKGVDFHKN